VENARVGALSREVEFLLSPRGGEALAAARSSRGDDPLARRSAMGRLFAAEEARWALAQDALRVRAAAKTSLSDVLLFEKGALEQASAAPVALERARRFAGFRSVADLGAGIGLDAIALASVVPRVVAVERDPGRAALLSRNVEAAGVASRVEVVVGDFVASPPSTEAAFVDPDRRPGGKRTRDPEATEPPPAAWRALASRYRGLLAKLAPATPPVEGGGGTEWVSLDGGVREARFGTGALALSPPRRALVLPSGATVEGGGAPWPPPRAPQEGDVLLDPDPAVVVAGLVGDAAISVGARPVHARIAYLVGDRGAPWARSMRVERVLPASIAALRRELAERDAGDVEILSRGVAEPPDAWRKRLKPRGRNRATLVLTRGPSDRYLGLVGSPWGGGGIVGAGTSVGPGGRP
jgi:protein-L-isoaspartate O-methyltransferase